MKGAFPVFDGEVKTGEDLQPLQNHPGGGLQGAIPSKRPVASTQNKWPVQKVIFIVLQEEDYRE